MPKKNSKAALKKKQKKQKAKAKQQNQQNKNQQNGKNGKNNNNGNKNDPKSITGENDVLKMTDNPDEMLKEFVRDINIHNFSRKQIYQFSYHQIIP